eukprot:1619002-Amphidinium_carterae.1
MPEATVTTTSRGWANQMIELRSKAYCVLVFLSQDYRGRAADGACNYEKDLFAVRIMGSRAPDSISRCVHKSEFRHSMHDRSRSPRKGSRRPKCTFGYIVRT